MSRWFEDSSPDDESFGPGTDLVVSLLAVLFVFVAVERMAAQMSRPLPMPIWTHTPSPTLTKTASRARTPTPLAPSVTPTPDRRNRQHLWDFCEESSEKPLFEKGTDVLTEAAKEILLSQIEALKARLRDGTANQLQLIGYASPETSITSDRAGRERLNLDLSVRRAVSVADFLYEHGIPYECISISAFGRSHSTVLHDWFQEHGGESIASWDEVGQRNVDQSDPRLSRERRVEVWGIWHHLSQCNPSWSTEESSGGSEEMHLAPTPILPYVGHGGQLTLGGTSGTDRHEKRTPE